MSDNRDRNFSNHIGGWMTFTAWIAFIVFLGYSINLFLQHQNNPNQSVSTAYINGTKQVILTRNRQGHYVTTGKINNQTVVFLLDTGATDVALSMRLANKLHLKLGRQFKVQTANGIAIAHQARLNHVAIGEITLNNVPASILNNGLDNQVLLGMAFLKHFELTQKGKQLTIRQ